MAGYRARVADRAITINLGGSDAPPLSDAGTATIGLTPTAAETISDQATQSLILATQSQPPNQPVPLDTFDAGALQALTARAGWGAGHNKAGDGSFVTDAVPTYANEPGGAISNLWATQFPADQESIFVVGSTADTTGAIVRGNSPSGTPLTAGYELSYGWNGAWGIYPANSISPIASDVAGSLPNLAAGDEISLQAIGRWLSIWRKPSAGSWTLLKSVQDTVSAGAGYAGISAVSGSGGRVDSFRAGQVGLPGTISDAGTCTMAVSQTAAQTISDAGSVTAVLVPSAAQTINDAGTVAMSLTPTAAIEASADASTAALTIAPSGTETISDSGTQVCVLAPSAAQTISEPAATVTMVLAPSTTQEAVSEAASQVIVIDPTYPSVVLADGPDVYYRLDETGAGPWVDSANGHNATPNGTIIPHASLLPADSDPDTLLDPASTAWRATTGYLLDNQPLTIEFWINPTSLAPVAPGYSVVVSCSNASNGWMVSYLQGNLGGWWRFTLPGVADYVFSSTAAPAAVGVLQHIVMVFKVGNTVDLYIDGVLAQTIATGTKIAATGGTLRIGQIAAATTAQVSAALGELAIYKAALSAAQIAKHYAIGAQPSPQTLVDSGTCYVGVEVGDSTPVLDDFNKGAAQNVSSRFGFGSGAYWGEPTHVVNGTPDAITTPVGSGWFANYWNDVFTDQEAWGTYGGVGTSQFWIVGTRSSVGNNPSDYELQVTADTGDWSLDWYITGVSQGNLGAGTFPSHASGDSFKLRSVGSKHTVLFKPAGGEWSIQGTFTEATLTSGRITLQGRANVTAGSLSDFGGGGLATPAVESVSSGDISDSGTASLSITPSASEVISDAVTCALSLASSATERENDSGSISLTLAQTAAQTLSDVGSQNVVLTPTVAETPADSGTCVVSVTPTGAETLSEAASVVLVLAPSYAFVWPDAGTVTLVLLPSAAEQVRDATTVTFVLTEADSDRESDQGTVSISLTPSAAEALVDASAEFFVIARGDLFGPDDLVHPDDLAGPDYVHGFEAIVDASTVTVILVPSASQTISESGSTFVTITPTQQGIEQGAQTIVLSNSATELISDAGTATVGITPSAVETLVEHANESFTIARGDLFEPGDLVYPDDIAGPDYVHGFEAIVDAATCVAVLVASATETRADATTATIVLAGTALERPSDAGSVTLVLASTAAEQKQDSGSLTIVLSQTEFDASGEAGTCTLTMVVSASEQVRDAGTATLVFPETAGEADQDAGTATVAFVASGAEAILESATVTFVLSESETDLITTFESGTCTLVFASSAAETLEDAGTQTATLTPSAVGQAAELATASLALTPSGTETLEDTGTQPVVLSQTGVELVLIAQTGTATFTITPTAAETIRDGTSQSFAMVLDSDESIVQASTQIIVLAPSAAQTPTDAGTASLTLLATTTTAQPLEAGTCTFSVDGTGAETLVGAPATVTFVVTPTYFGGAPGAVGNLSITLSQTAVQTLTEDAVAATNVIVIAPSHDWTAGFDVNPAKPPLAGGDAAVRRREHDRAARVKALRAGDPQHRDRRLVRR